ncbi:MULTISPECIES: amino acid decarboxylase [Caproicibacterium]|jgi:arginine/lysine/ornithine decarboxylase|uniref:Amino acid decarboxylase n=1 Tax=Caproicibacterium lactatifermentans TaxID=2666138 RepID=A0A859DMS5_9FIRM|nr:amino acid decarboxylase [Caproicibacterium lactatifermentans]ARP49444.1 amino acid decarboxylase [Ruminococcaceae bacterium CPB6]MDD4806938.1 amino acid decarboxylase [Oscillospiraceae bacterium]QKN23036.1 amino acid decarboxylase [Caproicibacterium lactatifermentans]QKO30358.1 amino acid decarboxylase [Caproicibacterium lactatifermentans]
MSETPLYTALRHHHALHRAPFHTPGHKCAAGALPPDLLQLDYTELPDTDSLFEASGPILQAEQAAAALFGARRTLFSAGGCSLCIQTMLRLSCPQGGTVLCARNAHRTAVNAMALLGLTPLWVMPKNILNILNKNTDRIDACYVTNPDYYGRLLDISALAAACRRRNIPLLVDNAHGTQLAFTQPDLHPLHQGASMTADSAHKTLNVLTGGAWLQIGEERYVPNAKGAMQLFASTSPSYPIMASLDLARAFLQEHPDAFVPVQRRVQQLSQQAASRGILNVSDDPTRLSLKTAEIGLTGTRAAEIFRQNGVEPEMADGAYVVLIATPWNIREDFARAARAIAALPVGEPLSCGPELPALPPVRMPLRKAVFSASHEVPLQRAAGCIAAEAACPCPPGIPVVMPGEEITPQAVQFLGRYGFLSLRVL